MQPLLHLDELWIQVAGTLCNLSCSHCFVPSGPGIDRHELFRKAYCALLAAGRDGRSRVLAYSAELERGGATSGLEGLSEVAAVDRPAG